jgi:hypothetical protein
MYVPPNKAISTYLLLLYMVTEEGELRINNVPSTYNLKPVLNTRDGIHGDIFGESLENLSAVKSQSWVSF